MRAVFRQSNVGRVQTRTIGVPDAWRYPKRDFVRRPVAWGRGGGRGQECVARRDGADVGARGHPGSPRLRHHRRCLSRLPRGQRPEPDDRRDAGEARRREAGAARGRVGDPRGDHRGRLAREHRRGYPCGLSRPRRAHRRGEPGCSRPFQRDRRGPAGCELRRPAGDVPERPRRRGAARRLPALLRLALHRPCDHLPAPQGVRPYEGGAVRRHPADGARRSRAVPG